jgi:hypothetical protein
VDEQVHRIAEEAQQVEPFLADIEARAMELRHLRDIGEISLEEHLELFALESDLQLVA